QARSREPLMQRRPREREDAQAVRVVADALDAAADTISRSIPRRGHDRAHCRASGEMQLVDENIDLPRHLLWIEASHGWQRCRERADHRAIVERLVTNLLGTLVVQPSRPSAFGVLE